MTATTMRTVIACAVRDPQASSSTLEATDVAVFNSSSGIEPSASVHPHVTVVVDEAAAAQLENAEFYRYALKYKPPQQKS
jgi:hypothetical protein